MAVEIIGRACVAPGARNPSGLFRVLKARRCTVTKVPAERWDQARYWHPVVGTLGKTYSFAAGVIDDIFDFDPTVFGMSKREALYLDPQQRVMLELTWRALEDANIDHSSLDGKNIGVYVGASSLDHANLMVEDPAAAGPYFMSGNTLSVVSNRISHVFGLSGPSMTVDTACSSSLVALDQAMKAIASGVVDTAIVGGINILSHPLSFVGFAQARMLSPDGLCRAYDDSGAGYVRAEGGAIVILRRSELAAAKGDYSHATIIASGSNAAGRTNGISLPSREAQAALLRSVYDGNEIDVARLAFIEGHGTGTKVGDPAEVWSIGTAIGQRRKGPIPIGSIKSNIGHTEPASGLFGLMKAMLALENNYFPASLHFETPHRDIDFAALNVHVADKGIELLPSSRARLAGVNSFGFGGANAHVVISDPQISAPVPAEQPDGSVFIVSAHCRQSLEELLAAYATEFKSASKKRKQSLCASAGSNRALMKHRFVVPTQDPEQVRAAIDACLTGENTGAAHLGEAQQSDAKLAFVFSGNGSQWAGMGIDAYRSNTHFRRQFDAVSALFRQYVEFNLTDLLVAEDLDRFLADTRIAQPLLFAIQVALADTLIKKGVKPAMVFGHSVGEIAAAHISGAIPLVDAVLIIVRRSACQGVMAGRGKMAAAMMDGANVSELADRLGLKELAIAAYNAPQSVTVSGSADEIIAFTDAARQAGQPATILDIDYPFHHKMIDEVKPDFLETMSSLSLNETRLPFISSVTGDEQAGNRLDADYWWRNLREPVLFEAAARRAIELGATLFLEIGPQPVLVSYLNQILNATGMTGRVIASLSRSRPKGPAVDPVDATFALAIAHGAAIDRKKILGKRDAAAKHPKLPLIKEALQPARTSDAIDLYGRKKATSASLAGWRVDPNGSSWKSHLDANLFPDLAEHIVDGRAILPGSGFMEIAVSAAEDFFGTSRIDILNLEIVRPLELATTRLTELSTVISPETGDLEIRSRERLSDDDWSIHAVGRCRKGASLQPSPEYFRREWNRQDSPDKSMDGARVYDIARRFGLEYGPSFQLIESAMMIGDNKIVVSLGNPAASKNPYIAYLLHPILVDTAFHGLLARFGQLSGEAGGTPYIPVRFGAVQIYQTAADIKMAEIEILRFSQYSLKAAIGLLDGQGNIVAILDDCRFRRAHLRQRKGLRQVSYHYETVPTFQRAVPLVPAENVFSAFLPVQTPEPDGSTLLLRAAIYRACFDLAIKMASDRRIAISSLPPDERFRDFLTCCLRLLAQAGLAIADEDGWAIAEEIELPAFDNIFREILKVGPERIAEAMAVAETYADALRLAGKSQRSLEPMAQKEPAALRSHLEQHSPSARQRQAVLLEALSSAIRSGSSALKPAAHVVELGVTSMALSRRLADIVSGAGGGLTIIDRRDEIIEALRLEFADQPWVTVQAASDNVSSVDAHFIVSAYNGCHAMLIGERQLIARMTRLLENGATMIGAFDAPDLVTDFIFGLTTRWASSAPGIVPIAGSQAWQGLLDNIGAIGRVERQTERFGDLLLVTATANRKQPKHEGAMRSQSPKNNEIEHSSNAVFAENAPATEPIRQSSAEPANDNLDLLIVADGTAVQKYGLDADGGSLPIIDVKEAGASVVAAIVQKAIEQGVAVVLFGSAEDSSEALQADIALLSALAEELGRRSGEFEELSCEPTLIIMAENGAPVGNGAASPANAGLWAFARVLRNEYPSLTVHCIDAAAGHDWNSIIAPLIGDAIGGGERNYEWVIDRNNGALQQLRAVAGPLPRRNGQTRNYRSAAIRQKIASQISSIVWEERPWQPAGPGEVVIEIAATGLNFRDIMWGMGLLPEEALEDGFAGTTIGMECSGTVVEAGERVAALQIGDRVMAFAPAAFATHVTVNAEAVVKLPASIDLNAGATIPVAFLTAYYALSTLARLRPDETVLIHGGAGGVGLAAVQIAKHFGARIIATAGTAEKRGLLTRLGVDHVFDSRSLDFDNDVRRLTWGRGVDVVVNSLSGEAMKHSIDLLKPFGRFLELGKRDYFADSKIGLQPFRKNLSYFGIDVDQLLLGEKDRARQLWQELRALFEKEQLHPLPYRTFAYDEVQDAFRLMQASGHIGKIVVTPPRPTMDPVEVKTPTGFKPDPIGMHVVVGGIGGFGLSAADWLVEHGAKHIALGSRRGEADEETSSKIADWSAKGVTTHVMRCDVTVKSDVAAMLDHLRQQAPIRTIIHTAMVLDDALIANLGPERNRPVIDVKALGADILDRQSRMDDLQHFILFSSATTLIGNPGQANYVAANGYLEGLARARRAQGLPGLAVGFGAISDAGVLARDAKVGDLLAQRIGRASMRARDALAHVSDYIALDPQTLDAAALIIGEVDWNAVRNLAISRTSLVRSLALSSQQQKSLDEDGTIDLAALLAGKPADEARTLLYNVVAEEIAAILKLPVTGLSRGKNLKDIGLDSLMAVELGLGFQQKTGFEMPLSSVADTTTIGDIVDKLYRRVVTLNDQPGEAADEEIVSQLAERHRASG